MGFVDCCAEDIGFQFCPFAVPVVHPELDRIHLLLGLLIDGLARIGCAGDGNRNVAKSGGSAASGCKTSAGREQARAVGFALSLFITNLKRDIAIVCACGKHTHDAVIRVAVEIRHNRIVVVVLRSIRRAVVETRLSLEIEEHRRERSASQVHASGTFGWRHVALLSEGGELPVRNDERRILYDGTAVTGNHTTAKIIRDVGTGLLLLVTLTAFTAGL